MAGLSSYVVVLVRLSSGCLCDISSLKCIALVQGLCIGRRCESLDSQPLGQHLLMILCRKWAEPQGLSDVNVSC